MVADPSALNKVPVVPNLTDSRGHLTKGKSRYTAQSHQHDALSNKAAPDNVESLKLKKARSQ
ncbi:hypothetical protein KY46_03505 [Photobacterium halotolerans]|uniref:Uncharacterized protein n=1 Tax=Photobacterium halotolerans TaxID=265726 RepID=A0A0F5VHC0_9GAMM|nr:hypothetical protein KY46_03505 [Photobacterium halotolerans]